MILASQRIKARNTARYNTAEVPETLMKTDIMNTAKAYVNKI